MEGSPLEIRPGGYIEYRVVVQQPFQDRGPQGTPDPSSPTVAYYDDYLERNSRTVQVAHGSTLVVSLFQPSLAVTDQSLAVEIDGVRQKDLVELPVPFGRGFRLIPRPRAPSWPCWQVGVSRRI